MPEETKDQININNLDALHQDALQRLEWPLLLKHLSGMSALKQTKDFLLKLSPWNMKLSKEFWFQMTEEGLKLNAFSSFYFFENFESSDFLLLLKRQGILSAKNLFSVYLSLKNSNYYKNKILEDKFFSEKHPMHFDLFSKFQIPKNLLELLEKSVNAEGHILATASLLLYELTKRLQNTKRKISEVLDQSLEKSSLKNCLQEKMWIFREGRYLLPIKIEYKNEVSGVVRSVSQTGSTVFIEPEFLAKHHLELDKILSDIEIENHRILVQLSNECSEFYESIFTNCENLTLCDLTSVRTQFAACFESTKPVFVKESENFRFDFKNAKHPLFLFENKKVVANDLYLGRTTSHENPLTWILSGPNAGGKTIVLKTVGIFYLLAQSGFYITAQDAKLQNFQDIFVELGDRQNREEELSTFSGHLNQIQKILSFANAGSLILLDEGFVGTDPLQGVALARATLEYFADLNCTVLMTTHFSNLKTLSSEDFRFLNASMEFEKKNLVPTYKLLNEIPGQSYALELAQRLCLPVNLLDRAQFLLGKESNRFEQLLQDLQDKRKNTEELNQTQQSQIQVLKDEIFKLQKEKSQFISERDQLMETYRRRLEKRLNSFENKLEVKERQFEKFQKEKLKTITDTLELKYQDKNLPKESSKNLLDEVPQTKIDDRDIILPEESESRGQQSIRPVLKKFPTKQFLLHEAQEALQNFRHELNSLDSSFQRESNEILKKNSSTQSQKEKQKEILQPKVTIFDSTFWKEGMKIKILSLSSPGIVLKKSDNKGFVECAFGLIKKKCHSSELNLFENSTNVVYEKEKLKDQAKNQTFSLDKKDLSKKTGSTNFNKNKETIKYHNRLNGDISSVFPHKGNTIDLREFKVLEAIDKLEVELDKLFVSHATHGVIIHGHGTGALKEEVRKYLKTCPYSLNFRPGRTGEGSDGVTVVEFGL